MIEETSQCMASVPRKSSSFWPDINTNSRNGSVRESMMPIVYAHKSVYIAVHDLFPCSPMVREMVRYTNDQTLVPFTAPSIGSAGYSGSCHCWLLASGPIWGTCVLEAQREDALLSGSCEPEQRRRSPLSLAHTTWCPVYEGFQPRNGRQGDEGAA